MPPPISIMPLFTCFTTAKGSEKHLGLGMYMVNTLVTQKMSGQIHITSAFGEGIKIWIVIPDQSVSVSVNVLIFAFSVH